MLSGSNFPIALLLTLLAGLSTGLGGVIVLLTKKFSTKTLSLALGFSAGVMLFISLTELFTEARTGLGAHFGDRMGLLYTVLAFFAGIGLIAVIDNVIPSKENPHEYTATPPENGISDGDSSRLMRLGLFSVIAIAIHNFPDGMATFVSAM